MNKMDKKEEFIAICADIYILTNRFSVSQEMFVFYGTRWFITALTALATCPFPEPDQSSPCFPTHFPKNFSSLLRLGYVLIQTKNISKKRPIP
jgi:hypothetical protein